MRRSVASLRSIAPRRVDWDFVSFWLAYLAAYFEGVWLVLS